MSHKNHPLLKIPFLSILLFLAMLHPIECLSQEDQKTKEQQEFDKFHNEIKKDFRQFSERNDSLFLSFLEGAWKEFTLHEEQAKKRPKPVVQPSVKIQPDSIEVAPSKHKLETIDAVESDDRQSPDTRQSDDENNPVKNNPEYITPLNFYGHGIPLPSVPDLLSLATINQADIIEFYQRYLQQKELIANANELMGVGKELRLNDWGVIQLMMMASGVYFPAINDRVLFTWITLQRNGYDVKIGHDRKQVYLLPQFTGKIFSNPYVSINSKRYTIIPIPGQDFPSEGITSFEASYPGESRSLSLLLPELPALTEQPATRTMIYRQDTIRVQIAKSLVQFLHSYPSCELAVYFNAPLSAKAMKSLDEKIRPLLQGRAEQDQANLLLDFVQRAIPYQTDEQQFGGEHYLFADETLYFPYADCEDRAVLFARLIQHYTGLKAIGLDYPDHVSTAIRFSKQLNGDFLIFDGDKYFICDPTYIGAKAGMIMEGLQYERPNMIQID
ncbi:MAG: hypothetical protein V1764_04280 [Nitrospirota bacterium]